MAENVDLGTFTFDAESVTQNIDRLRKEMSLLRDERKKYGDQEKDWNKIIDATIKKQEELIATNQEESKEMKNANALLKASRAERDKVAKTNAELASKHKVLNNEYKQSTKAIDSLKNSEGELVTATEAINIALDKEVRSIADARASNKELLALRNQLSIAGGENEEELKNLNKALDENNAFIKENVSAYEKQKIGIGDYQTAIKNALGDTKLFGVGLNDVKNSLNQFAPVLNLIKGELTSIKDSFKTATASTQGFSTAQKAMAVTTSATSGALKLLKVALISTGIGAIVVVLGSLISYLSTTQAGIDAVTKVTRPLSAVFQTFLGIIQEVGEFIGGQLMKQFQAISKVVEGLVNFDFSKIKEGITDIGKNAIDTVKGVAEIGSTMGDKFDEAYTKGQKIDELQKSIEQKEIDMIAYRSEQEIQLKRLENIQKNQLLSAEERNKAIEDGEKIAKDLVARENEILDLNIEQLKIKQSLNDTSREEEKQLQGLIAARIASESKILEVEAKSLGDKKQLQDQARNAAIARTKEIQDQAIKANQEQLELFKAEVGFKKKSDEQKLEIAKETRDRELEILEQELEFKRISIEQFNTKKIELNNTYLELERDIVIANAEAERDAILNELDKRKNDYAEYTEANLELDRANIAERLAVEQEFAEQQLEQGVINQEEFDTVLSELKAEARDAEQEAVIEFEEANKERLLLDAENERILAEQKYTDQFELQKFRLEQRRLAEIEAAEKTGADLALINEKYAKYNEDINRKQQASKVQLASDAFNNIATILGKESAVGKAVAIAQTTIDTYKSATAAYSALAGITIVGPVLGALAAGAAVAAGLANVKKIASTSAPKAERGMRVPRWGTMLRGRSHKQGGIPIEAEGGEAIINKRSTSMFGGLLSAINVAGGGIPLAARGALVGGGSSGNAKIQSNMMQEAFGVNMTEMISDAVRDGSMEGSAIGTKSGSQSGIIGLSENRQVQQNSSF